MKNRLLYFFIFLCLCMPVIASAQGGIFGVSPNDKSMEYLGMVFGGVSNLPIPTGGNELFRKLAYIFNQIVFTLGIVIVIGTTVIGTLATAQEGEVMGKKWSSLIVPARAGFGVYLLLPGASGYSWIQISVMWFIIQGVGAANALWQQVIYSNESQGSVTADTRKTDLNNAQEAVETLFKSLVCMQAMNDWISADEKIAEFMNHQYITYYINEAGNQIHFGRENHPEEAPLCGAIQIPSIGNFATNAIAGSPQRTAQQQELIANAMLNAIVALQPAVLDALSGSPSTWSINNAQSFVIAARSLTGAAQALSQTFTSLNQHNQKAIIDGWIMAGSYYFTLVTGGTYVNQSITIGNASPINKDKIEDLLGETRATAFATKHSLASSGYITFVKNVIVTVSPAAAAGGSLTPAAVNLPGQARSVFDAIFGQGFFGDLAADLGKQITTGCMSDSTDPNDHKADPVTCMAHFGATLSSTTELVFWISMITIFGIWLGTQVMSCAQPLAHAMNFVLMIIVPITTMMIGLLWMAGISLALYVPMIPYLVFTFSAVSWLILVIETMLAAPLIALTLIIPSEDELGKAGHTLMILFGIFMRPALMILGFIFAMKMLSVAVNVLNFGFKGTLQMTIAGGIGLFGFVSVILVYSGIAVSLVHEAFSLIYVLPDKVLRWMGGSPEGIEAGAQVKQLEGAVDSGSAMGKQYMTGAIQQGSSKAKKGLGV